MTAAHTPGPWSRFGVYSHIEIRNESSELVAVVESELGEERFQNARLISAAPDLLAALCEWLAIYGGPDHEDCPEVIQTRSAIAKATGGTP